MEKEFAGNRYPCPFRQIELANALELAERHIEIWFKNRRGKYSKDVQNSTDKTKIKDLHAVIPTNVINKNDNTDVVEPRQQNSFDGYGGNLYFSYDQQFNNN